MKQSAYVWRNIGAFLVGGILVSPAVAASSPAEDAAKAQATLQTTLAQRCEKRWTKNFVPMAKAQLPATDPLNDESRVVVLDVAADAKGKVIAAEVATPSGATALDDAAKEIALDTGPFPKLDEALLSDDGNLHVSWVFARKDGRCDDVQIRDVRMSPDFAIPSLLSQGRTERAWQRLVEAVTGGDEKAVGVYARHWLKRASKDKKLATVATAALAEGGDRESAVQMAALAEAGKLPAASWPSLARAGQSICPLSSKALQGNSAADRLAALKALTIRLDKACVGATVTVALNAAAPVEERVAALQALANSTAEEARAGAKKAMADANAQVRAAAVRSWAQADMGRKALFALTPLLKDNDIALRAAANAGVARSSGDKGLEQLYLVYKEKDASIYEALSEELGQMNTEASAEMLRKFMNKDDKRIRRAAASALASRSDKYARAASGSLVSDAEPTLRILAAHALPATDRQAVAREVAADPKVAWHSYGVLLTGGPRQAAALLMLEVLPRANDSSRIEWLKTWLRAGDGPSKMAASRP